MNYVLRFFLTFIVPALQIAWDPDFSTMLMNLVLLCIYTCLLFNSEAGIASSLETGSHF